MHKIGIDLAQVLVVLQACHQWDKSSLETRSSIAE
jgi:hypothetical protein